MFLFTDSILKNLYSSKSFLKKPFAHMIWNCLSENKLALKVSIFAPIGFEIYFITL